MNDGAMTTVEPLKARATLYCGIRMRSRLEGHFAAYLDRLRVRWTYEPMAFASVDGQYLPDFELHDIGGRRRVFVEVKPVDDLKVLTRALERMQIIRASVPDAVLMVFAEDRWIVDFSSDTVGRHVISAVGRGRFEDLYSGR